MPLVKIINFKDVYAKIKEVLFLLVLVLPVASYVIVMMYYIYMSLPVGKSYKEIEKPIYSIPLSTESGAFVIGTKTGNEYYVLEKDDDGKLLKKFNVNYTYINEISNDQQPYAKYIYEVVHRRDGSSSEKDLEKVILYVPQDTIIQDFNLK